MYAKYASVCRHEPADGKQGHRVGAFCSLSLIAKSTAARRRISARSTTLHTIAIIGDMSMFIEIWSRERERAALGEEKKREEVKESRQELRKKEAEGGSSADKEDGGGSELGVGALLNT